MYCLTQRLASSDDPVNATDMATNEEVTVSVDDCVADNNASNATIEDIAKSVDHVNGVNQRLAYTEPSVLVMFPPSDEILSQQSCADPLSDPLAFDDSLTGRENTPYERNPLELINTELPTGTEANDDILLVDVERLKNSSPFGDRVDANPFEEIPNEQCSTEVEEGVRSDGSDSGLGSEPSNNVLTVPAKPAVCE